jgi:hypothetical protein
MTERVGFGVDTLTIRIPIRLHRRGGRKLIMMPEGPQLSRGLFRMWPFRPPRRPAPHSRCRATS